MFNLCTDLSFIYLITLTIIGICVSYKYPVIYVLLIYLLYARV